MKRTNIDSAPEGTMFVLALGRYQDKPSYAMNLIAKAYYNHKTDTLTYGQIADALAPSFAIVSVTEARGRNTEVMFVVDDLPRREVPNRAIVTRLYDLLPTAKERAAQMRREDAEVDRAKAHADDLLRRFNEAVEVTGFPVNDPERYPATSAAWGRIEDDMYEVGFYPPGSNHKAQYRGKDADRLVAWLENVAALSPTCEGMAGEGAG